ncbi:PREDICTED: espin-like, partial [Amphimedon queenslandica]|uniref:Uncharacterized protein n=1 Tax=Amphimedon queenslandica TaxID=400682 RepID=A0AAN0ITT7_AMPQE
MSLEDKCGTAFRNKDHEEAVRLLPLVKEVKEPNEIKIAGDGGNQVDVMRYLIDECHCDPMAVSGTGGTPLHVATSCGSSAAVGYLLSTGKCDPLAKDNEGRTPFKLAKERGHTDTLSVLKKF